MFIIEAMNGEGYWSNEFGWVEDKEHASTFSDSDRDTLNLPLGGRWVEMNDNQDGG
jgi:hypothetical protein